MSALTDYPTFLGIGAQKSGTSWLGLTMAQHPEIAMSRYKELHFFDKADNYNKGFSWYRDQFCISATTKAVGEFTPGYFATNYDELDILEHNLNEDIPKLVYEAYPDLKLILSLRDPTMRAISSYFHHIRKGRISPRQRILEVGRNLAILSRGFYDVHMRKWLEYYPLDKFLVLIYEEDLGDDAKKATLRRVFEHVGVDPSFQIKNPFARYNVQASHFDMRLNSWPKLIRKTCRKLVPTTIKQMEMWRIEINDAEIETLRKLYKKHNLELEKILGRKVPWP